MSNEKTSFVYVTYIRSTPEKCSRPSRSRRSRDATGATKTSRIGSPDRPGSTCARTKQRTVQLVGKVVEAAPPTRLVITWANASQELIRPATAA